MSLELRNRLETAFGVRLSATLVWNHPTIRHIAPVLAGKLGLSLGDDAVPVPRPRDEPSTAGALEPADPNGLLERELAELTRSLEDL
jgi:hypothetical protein